jgi:hypothetical protein
MLSPEGPVQLTSTQIFHFLGCRIVIPCNTAAGQSPLQVCMVVAQGQKEQGGSGSGMGFKRGKLRAALEVLKLRASFR